MPRLNSPHDNTSDARQALLNRYYASSERKTATFSSDSLRTMPRPTRLERLATQKCHPSQANIASASGSLSREEYKRAVRWYENPQPRPLNHASGTLWVGSEPDVDDTFFRWDGSIELVPVKAIQNAIREFEAGNYIGNMSVETKTALVHVVTQGILQNRLSSTNVTLPQIRYFLIEAYQCMVTHDPQLVLPRGGHWLFRTLRDRTDELQWLKYQAEHRWWDLVGRRIEDIDRRLEEPLESEVDALFNSYTYHSELPHLEADMPSNAFS